MSVGRWACLVQREARDANFVNSGVGITWMVVTVCAGSGVCRSPFAHKEGEGHNSGSESRERNTRALTIASLYFAEQRERDGYTIVGIGSSETQFVSDRSNGKREQLVTFKMVSEKVFEKGRNKCKCRAAG